MSSLNSKPQLIMDTEVFPNFWLISFLDLHSGKVKSFTRTETKELDTYPVTELLEGYEIITFNGNKYDIPMIRLALTGATCKQLKRANDQIIGDNMTAYNFAREYKLKEVVWNHIDLIEVAPMKASLKTYGGRIHCPKMQDLPYEPDHILTSEEMILVEKYCVNDLEVTKLLYEKLIPQINLRRNMSNQYKIDLRSKSDAQIAETVIVNELVKLLGYRPSKPTMAENNFKYKIPDFIQFKTPQLNNVLDLLEKDVFWVRANGAIDMPKALAEMKIKMGSSTYQMGMGGLHSQESSVYHKESAEHLIADFDVASYYPNIIINQGLYPQQLGESFLKVYSHIVTERLGAKKNGDKVKDASLKTVINSSFGKMGSMYSPIYAPDLMVQVTVTGQLSLLMLIETLEATGISVVSANTDGIVIKCKRILEKQMEQIIENWEKQTAFTMERSDYAAVYSRDVSNYFAIKLNGTVKTKGCFSTSSLSKNPTTEIVAEAVIAHLKDGTELMDTIRGCTDITKFVAVRNVKGGAVDGATYLGKVIRWYYAKKVFKPLNYKTNNSIVPKSFGAKPLMDLPKMFPHDVDYQWYYEESRNLLNDIGVKVKGQMALW